MSRAMATSSARVGSVVLIDAIAVELPLDKQAAAAVVTPLVGPAPST